MQEDSMTSSLRPSSLLASALALLFAASTHAASPRAIHDRIDDARRVTLSGNTRPDIADAVDLGRLPDSRPLSHLILQLKRSPEGEAALERFIAALHDPQAPEYHQWLTPAQFADRFGVAREDVAAVRGWLVARGFTINGISPTGLQVDFGGTVGQVRRAFGTELHALSVDGTTHFANVRDPSIPAALRPAVEGIVALHDFHPRAFHVPRGPGAQYTDTGPNGVVHGLAAADLATIYNLTPLFSAGFTGSGQTIMVLEDTYLYSVADWQAFRDTFGLTAAYPEATLQQVSPQGALKCANPGFQGRLLQPGYGDDGEAALDVEWASAAAPNAAIVLAACTDTGAFGGLTALQNTLDGPASALPTVVSMSYGEAETVSGATQNASFKSAFQQAVAEGVSVFVSSGDSLAAAADPHAVAATHGIAVSGWASSPYDVAVGGTDFSYTANGVDPSTYWNATNSSVGGSALSYIPEIPWNNSCAGSVVTGFLGETPSQLCNEADVVDPHGTRHFLANDTGGSGGASGCATGAPAAKGVVGGTCAGYAKPSWQAGLVGNPKDGVRDLPDVALFASNGFWDAYYIICWSNPDRRVGGGGSCAGTPGTWPGVGGTSVSAPIMAGIQALVNQKTGRRWGNPNAVLYKLAKAEYGSTGSAACNSGTVDKRANACQFYDITQGDLGTRCTTASDGTSNDCFVEPGETYGVLSTSGTTLKTAYATRTGWDFATGIGSVNAFNLVMGWPVR
jgi:subtilase family serine protease